MDKWIIGLKGLILGLGTVFLVLILLIAFIYFLSKIVHTLDKTQAPKKEEKIITITENKTNTENNESEIIAAIAAALACLAQKEGKKFKIRSFRRV